jgi:hypothetical protein
LGKTKSGVDISTLSNSTLSSISKTFPVIIAPLTIGAVQKISILDGFTVIKSIVTSVSIDGIGTPAKACGVVIVIKKNVRKKIEKYFMF